MKKIILTFALILVFFTVIGQVTITKSTKTIIENGNVYYLHLVEQGQTVYGLTKAYGVTENELISLNPQISEGLKIGQEIKILKEGIATDLSSKSKIVNPNSSSQMLIDHKVEAGETLYKIMKTYNVSLDELNKHNPGLTSNLQLGQIIKIPTKVSNIAEIAQSKHDSIIDYKVRKKDNYSKLSRKFNISQAAIEQMNPILKEKGLQEGMFIKLPYTEGADIEEIQPIIESNLSKTEIEPKAEPIIEKVIEPQKELQKEPQKEIVKETLSNKTFKIGIVMPFFTGAESEIRTDNEFFMKSQENYQSFKYIQYYEGLLMALDTMKSRGFNAEVYVYDTKADTNATRVITNKPEFKDLDLIFGPFFARNLKIIVPAAAKNKTLVVSPFTVGVGVDKFDNLFVIESSNYSLWFEGMKYVKDSLPQSHIYIIQSGKPSELQEIKEIRAGYKKAGGDSLRIHIYSTKDAGFKSLLNDIKKDRDNIVINLSESEPQISSFVRVLNQNRENNKVILMGRADQWAKFKTVEDEYLVNLNLTLISNSFIDYRQAAVQNFVWAFHSNYKIDPQMIAFKGYDEGLFFLSVLHKYGNNYNPTKDYIDFQGVHNQFNFINSGKGKWINTHGCIYQYQNFELIDKRKPLIPYIPQTDKNLPVDIILPNNSNE